MSNCDGNNSETLTIRSKSESRTLETETNSLNILSKIKQENGDLSSLKRRLKAEELKKQEEQSPTDMPCEIKTEVLDDVEYHGVFIKQERMETDIDYSVERVEPELVDIKDLINSTSQDSSISLPSSTQIKVEKDSVTQVKLEKDSDILNLPSTSTYIPCDNLPSCSKTEVQLENDDECEQLNKMLKEEEMLIADEDIKAEKDDEIGDDDNDNECSSDSESESTKILKKENTEIIPDTKPGTAVFSCSLCSYKTTIKDNLKLHNLNHRVEDAKIKTSEGMFYKCLEKGCSYLTKQKYPFINHLVRRHSEKEDIIYYNCKFCIYKTYMKMEVLRHEVRVHNSFRYYHCNQCSFKAIYHLNLRKHIRTNHPEKIFKCNFCSYQTKRTDHFKQHQRVHKGKEGVGVFKCGNCSFSTCYKQVIFRHLERHTKKE